MYYVTDIWRIFVSKCDFTKKCYQPHSCFHKLVSWNRNPWFHEFFCSSAHSNVTFSLDIEIHSILSHSNAIFVGKSLQTRWNYWTIMKMTTHINVTFVENVFQEIGLWKITWKLSMNVWRITNVEFATKLSGLLEIWRDIKSQFTKKRKITIVICVTSHFHGKLISWTTRLVFIKFT